MDFSTVGEIWRRYKAAAVSTELHPNDMMYNAGKGFYYKVGESGIDCVLASLGRTDLTGVSRIMDLPCGHGRVGRHLRAAFPDAALFMCDIDKEGVDFCAQAFNATPVYSEIELTKAELPKDLDLIWIGSLFTHLSRDTTARWLSFLSSHLRQNGLLVATFHGYFTAFNGPFGGGGTDAEKIRRGFDAMGYGFDTYPSYPIEAGEYGFSLSKPSTILDMADAIPGTRVVAYTERGWARNHDVLTLCRDDRLRPFA